MKRGNFRDDGDNRNVDLDLYDRDDGLASGKNYAFGEQQDVLRGMLERLRESVFDRLDARKVEWSSHEEFSDNKQMYVMLFDLVASEMDFLFEGIAYASRIILLTELAEYAAVTRPIKRSVSSLFSLMRVVQSRFLSRTADKAGAIALHSFAYTQFFLHTHTILHRHPYLRAIASNRHAFVNSTHPLLRNALRSIGYLRAQARGLAPSTHEHCDQILEALGHVYKFINQHNTRKDFPRGSGAGDNVLGISNEHVWDRLAIQEAYARAIPGARVADAFSKEDMDAVVEAFRALQVLMLDHKHSIEHDQDTRPKLFGQTFVDLKNPSDEEDVWEVGVDKDTVTARLLRCYAGPLEASGVFDAAGGGGDTLLHKKGTLPYHMYRFLDHLYNVADMADTSANFVQMLDIPDDETYTFFRPRYASPVVRSAHACLPSSPLTPPARFTNFAAQCRCARATSGTPAGKTPAPLAARYDSTNTHPTQRRPQGQTGKQLFVQARVQGHQVRAAQYPHESGRRAARPDVDP